MDAQIKRKTALLLALLVISYVFLDSTTNTISTETSFKTTSGINKTEVGSTNISLDSDTHGQTTNKTTNYMSDGAVRVLLYYGCSGSTAAFQTIVKILSAHGYRRLPVEHELHKPEFNYLMQEAETLIQESGIKYSQDDVLLKTFEMFNEQAISSNSVLSFKAFYNEAKYIDKLENRLFAGLLRKNQLDSAICFAKDCFEEGKIGYSVFAENGTRADLCFQRRSFPGLKLKVQLDIDELERFLTEWIDHDDRILNKYEDLISPGKIQFYEDLFAFEYTSDDNTFQESLDAWASLMKSFVNNGVNMEILKNVLLPLKNTRPYPPPHRDIIQNYDEVEQRLKMTEPPLDYLLRR